MVVAAETIGWSMLDFGPPETGQICRLFRASVREYALGPLTIRPCAPQPEAGVPQVFGVVDGSDQTGTCGRSVRFRIGAADASLATFRPGDDRYGAPLNIARRYGRAMPSRARIGTRGQEPGREHGGRN